MATTTTATIHNPLHHYLPRSPLGSDLDAGVADLRAEDPLKQRFFAHLIPEGAELRLLVRFTAPRPGDGEPPETAARVTLEVRRTDPSAADGELEHTVHVTVDARGVARRMSTHIGADRWKHTPRTAERTLRVLARHDAALLCAMAAEHDPATRLRADIVRLEARLAGRTEEAYGHDEHGRAMRLDAPTELRDAMRELAEALLDRDGHPPVWWRPRPAEACTP
jgi:hypothetical protein